MNFQKLLKEREKELLKGLEAIVDSARPVDLNEPTGRLSRMDAMAHQQMALNAKKQLENSMEQLKQAFSRLEKDEYGICLQCEEEISEKRLKAKPEAPFCTSCQS